MPKLIIKVENKLNKNFEKESKKVNEHIKRASFLKKAINAVQQVEEMREDSDLSVALKEAIRKSRKRSDLPVNKYERALS